MKIDIERARRCEGRRQGAIRIAAESDGHREDAGDLHAAGAKVEHSTATVLVPRGLVVVWSVGRMRGVPEADQVHRVLDGFARAREEHEKKHECGDTANPAHGGA